MANAMLDARQEGDSYRRIEVITGERRRRRTAEEKARIVAESFEEGANISVVARRNGVASTRRRVTTWRGAPRAPTTLRASSPMADPGTSTC
jgi:transposase